MKTKSPESTSTTMKTEKTSTGLDREQSKRVLSAGERKSKNTKPVSDFFEYTDEAWEYVFGDSDLRDFDYE